MSPKIQNVKQVVICIIVGILLIFFGTSTQDYFFEACAVIMFIFAYILASWDIIFGKEKANTKNEVK